MQADPIPARAETTRLRLCAAQWGSVKICRIGTYGSCVGESRRGSRKTDGVGRWNTLWIGTNERTLSCNSLGECTVYRAAQITAKNVLADDAATAFESAADEVRFSAARRQ